MVALLGGRITGELAAIIDKDTYDRGLREGFRAYTITVSMAKAFTFAYIISSVSAYFGYNVQGGALEIGKSSTLAVVISCILILLADYVLTIIMLNP
jgi:phospholipid/cholesterol/gamma-HCH transport system permease protein